jgi:hypothetical protein
MEDRDRIWLRWGVPVFEQLMSHDFELLAEECDAHDGLHVRHSEYVIERGELICSGTPSGIAATLVTQPCPCGDPAPRLTNVLSLLHVAFAGA